jgi:hypothetical protein
MGLILGNLFSENPNNGKSQNINGKSQNMNGKSPDKMDEI